MRPLDQVFNRPQGADPGAQANQSHRENHRENHGDRTERRLAAQRATRRARQASALALALCLITLAIAATWADQTGRLGLWRLKTGIWIEERLARQGLALPELQVHQDQGLTTLAQVREAVGAYDLMPLNRLSPQDAQARLETLPWVAQARVQRLWPDRVNIWLTERVPLAALHTGGQVLMVDRAGEIIAPASEDMIRSFPNISGDGAAAAAPDLLQHLAQYPDIFGAFVGANRLSNRRWDIYLAPGVEVRLPAGQLAEGLARLQDLIAQEDILGADIVALDLRGRRPLVRR